MVIVKFPLLNHSFIIKNYLNTKIKNFFFQIDNDYTINDPHQPNSGTHNYAGFAAGKNTKYNLAQSAPTRLPSMAPARMSPGKCTPK